MRRFVFILLFIVSLSVIALLILKKQDEFDVGQKLVYNTYTKKWEEAKETPNVSLDEVVKNENPDGLHNYSIIKGYFDSYDENTSILTLKSVVPFTNANKFEVVNVNLLNSQTIYCAPNEYIDPNNGKTHLTKNLIYPVKDEETLFLPHEKTASFSDFIFEANDLTYLIIQLTKNFDNAGDNYIQKLIFIGSCN